MVWAQSQEGMIKVDKLSKVNQNAWFQKAAGDDEGVNKTSSHPKQ